MSKGIVIAGTHSSVGKTMITLGLIAALRRRGRAVQPFKVGPDYIDPTYHTLAAGRRCRNLDTWLVPRERVRSLFASSAQTADLAVVEGVMGLFDGIGYHQETGSTAAIAKLISVPVILVIDAAKMARSAAALAHGFQQFDPGLWLAGFIINRVGSDRHGIGVAQAVETATRLPVLGWLPRDTRMHITERHLGLLPAVELERWPEVERAAGDLIEAAIDMDLVEEIAAPIGVAEHAADLPFQPEHLATVAVARDEAFHFIYEENLELLRQAGAEIAFFSPLRDETLPPECSGIILSGGFPEVFASRLAANAPMHEALREAHRHNLPIYAECGGLMYLTQSIVDREGREHRMAGLLPGRSVMTERLVLGYRRARAAGSSWFLEAGEEVHGHEFHHSHWRDRPAGLPPAYFLQPASGQGEPWPEGARIGNLWASYVHLHFWGKPELASRFVHTCARNNRAERAGVP